MTNAVFENHKLPEFLKLSTIGEALEEETRRRDAIAAAASAERTRVLTRWGSYPVYYNALKHTIIEGPGEAYDRAYKIYLELFDHELPFAPDVYYYYFEQNHNKALQEKYGPFQYRVLSLEDPRDMASIGQISYLTVPLPENFAPYAAALYVAVTCVRPQSRMPKMADYMIKAAVSDIYVTLEKMGRPVPPGGQIAAFTNHMHPLAQSPRDFLVDSMGTGIDCFDRDLWFGRMGFRILDIPYRRPSPRADYSAEYAWTYKYAVRPAPGQEQIPADVFMYLHTRYCAMRQKPFMPENDKFYQELSAEAAQRPQIRLLAENNFQFARLRRQVRAWLHENRKADFGGALARSKFSELLRDAAE
ncbi:MAG: hypothetical protein GC131_06705 [Alphaproteobacteria bacterium]|nr:hypothetical protein [Alphaproteobacteria bacterium]